MSELKRNLGIFMESILFSLITSSMNLFDELVIVICDPIMEGLSSFWEGILCLNYCL